MNEERNDLMMRLVFEKYMENMILCYQVPSLDNNYDKIYHSTLICFIEAIVYVIARRDRLLQIKMIKGFNFVFLHDATLCFSLTVKVCVNI